MGTYDPILSGDLNIYNATLAGLALAGVAIVIAQVARSLRQPSHPVHGWHRLASLVGLVLIVLGIAVFATFAVAPPQENIPTWGIFYVLPLVFLAAVAVLSLIRPAVAGRDLAVAAVAVLLVELVLGFIAARIDPRWAEDLIDIGFVVVTGLVFCVPAVLTAFVLWLSREPMQPGGDEARPV